jgi:pilus assembly protein CpaF
MSWLRSKSSTSEASRPTTPAIGSAASNGVEGVTETAPPVIAASPADETKAWLDSLQSQSDPRLVAIKRELHQQVISTLDISAVGKWSQDQLRIEVRRQAEIVCKDRKDLLNASERERIVGEVMDEAFGLGPLEPLRRDPAVSDILINGPKTIYVERMGKLIRTPIQFHDDNHLVQIVQRIASQVGRRIDETSPMVDARLPDGSRLNAVIAPLALDGALVSIRRFGSKPLTVDRLVGNQSITWEMINFLEACVKARVNMVVSGGTGSGKTTLLNCLSGFIPEDERVATIEDAAELRLQQPHVVRMETRTANVEGTGEITTRELVRNALRMRPDRIIIGECRGSEALDMLQAMNTGHEGSLTTIHSNTTRDAVSRLEMMVGMAGFDLPIWIIRKQIASAIHIVLQVSRLMGGVRKVTKISEITGMEGDVLSMHDLFEFKQTGIDENRVAKGYYAATGVRPHNLDRIEAYGIHLPPEMFEKRILMKCEGRVST